MSLLLLDTWKWVNSYGSNVGLENRYTNSSKARVSPVRASSSHPDLSCSIFRVAQPQSSSRRITLLATCHRAAPSCFSAHPYFCIVNFFEQLSHSARSQYAHTKRRGQSLRVFLNYISFNVHPDHRDFSLEEYKLELRGTSTSISVGSSIEDRAANMWSLPMALISHHSPYLKAMSSGSVIFPKAHINLPDDDSAVFNLLWNGSSLQRVQKCAMGRLYEQHMEFSMACEDVEYAYANTSPTSKLRQFYMILSNKPSRTRRNCVDLLEIGMQFAEGSRPSHLITLEHPTKFILQVSPQIPERIYRFRRSQLHSDYTISYRTYEIVSQTEEEEQEKDVNGQHKE
ncbi:Ketoisovalerate reductase BEA2 [Fusarium oxysporum f. sp. albedinis]|nr:Ketoisovalerate reductase BEA2 [Fusarium oxysporum f. sp. albedinis]